jgi:hypothetical protein
MKNYERINTTSRMSRLMKTTQRQRSIQSFALSALQ